MQNFLAIVPSKPWATMPADLKDGLIWTFPHQVARFGRLAICFFNRSIILNLASKQVYKQSAKLYSGPQMKSFLFNLCSSWSSTSWICPRLSSLAFKGSLISESFSLWLKSSKNGAENYPEHYPSKEKMLRIVIWHLFLEIWVQVKTFLRLSHL